MLLLSLLPVLYASTTNAANPRLLPRADDVCLHQEDFREKVIQGDLAKASDFWASVGAQKVLSDYLDSHGVANWANDFLGSGYDCGSFPASNNCRSPEKASCSKYDPNAKYYLQISMSNLYNGFIRWHEALQDAAIQEVTSGIKGITDDWGPPKPSSVDVLGLILGASMAVTGFTDEAVEFPVEASMEIFQSVMEASKEAAAQDPADLEGDLEKSLGECFALMKSKLETAVQEIYLANSVGDQLASGLTGIFGHMLNPKEKILRIFNNGVWLDADIVNKAMDEWIKSMVQLIHDGLVVEAWKATTADQGYKKTILHRQSVSPSIPILDGILTDSIGGD